MALSTYVESGMPNYYSFEMKMSIIENKRALVPEGVGASVDSLRNLCEAVFCLTAQCFNVLTVRTYQEQSPSHSNSSRGQRNHSISDA